MIDAASLEPPPGRLCIVGPSGSGKTYTALAIATAFVESFEPEHGLALFAGFKHRFNDARDLCARDPQLAARGYFADVPTPEGGSVRLDGPPFVLSETPAAVQGPGPLLGEHTDAVLAELLGLGTPELAALRADGVVA